MTSRDRLRIVGGSGLGLWVASMLAPWFAIDTTFQVPNLHGHGPSAADHRVQETLWLWELGYAWPFALLFAGWVAGLYLAERGYRTALPLLLGVLVGAVGFVAFQWQLEGMWIPRNLNVGPFLALAGGALMTVAGVAGFLRD